jgi:hypothetical protein
VREQQSLFDANEVLIESGPSARQRSPFGPRRRLLQGPEKIGYRFKQDAGYSRDKAGISLRCATV